MAGRLLAQLSALTAQVEKHLFQFFHIFHCYGDCNDRASARSHSGCVISRSLWRLFKLIYVSAEELETAADRNLCQGQCLRSHQQSVSRAFLFLEQEGKIVDLLEVCLCIPGCGSSPIQEVLGRWMSC